MVFLQETSSHTMSPESTSPKSPMDESAKLVEVRAQLAALKVSLLMRKDCLQHEQEEQDRDRQEAQAHREEVDNVEAEQRVEADIAERREKAQPRSDMETVRAGLAWFSRHGRKSPESDDDDDSASLVATAVPRGDKAIVVIWGPTALADGESPHGLGKRKEHESGDGVSALCSLSLRCAESLKWDYYSVGCTNCIKQGLRCVPSSGPGTSCIVCWMRKVRCNKSEGPASNRAAKNKDTGTPKKRCSSRFINEEAGKDEMGVMELMRMVLATQTELSSTLQGIRDELRLWNNIAAMDWFSRSGMSGEGWTGERFAEWLPRWCGEQLALVQVEGRGNRARGEGSSTGAAGFGRK